jgi:hypothetical protein
VSSINEKSCWNFGATFGKKKKKKKKKNTKKKQKSNIPSPHKASPCHITLRNQESQMPAPNLLQRCRPTGEQISCMWYSTATPGINQHSPLDRQTPAPSKKKKKPE